MRYPTKYVLVTDLDENINGKENTQSTNNNCSNNNTTTNGIANSLLHHQQQQQNMHCTNSSNMISNSSVNAIKLNTSGNNNNINSSKNVTEITSRHIEFGATTSVATALVPDSPTNDLGNPLSMHIPLKPLTVLPERVWQDCVQNEANFKYQQQNENGNNENASDAANGSKGFAWEISNPSQKLTCNCVK